MEGKAVVNGVTPMSRRSRGQRASKITKAFQEAPPIRLDIASTSKNLKVGIPSSLDTPKIYKDLAGSPRQPSTALHKVNGVHLSSGPHTSASGTIPYVQGASLATPASDTTKSSLAIAGTSPRLKPNGTEEAGQSFRSLEPVTQVIICNGSSPLPPPDGAPYLVEPRSGRSLRTRQVTPFKKTPKRLKPFQEVALKDTDGPRILGRRIKVFWPLDSKWYYGEIKAYNSGKRLHKILYDDRDEEWLRLHKEKFKLQVLDGEAFRPQPSVLAAQGEVSVGTSKAASMGVYNGRASPEEYINGCANDVSLDIGNKIAAQALEISSGSHGQLLENFTGQGKSEHSSGEEVCPNLQSVGTDQKPDVVEGVPEKGQNGRASVSKVSEDPYAIDSTSRSDSLDSPCRPEQSAGVSTALMVPAAVEPSLEQPPSVDAKNRTLPICETSSACGDGGAPDLACNLQHTSNLCLDTLTSETCAPYSKSVSLGSDSLMSDGNIASATAETCSVRITARGDSPSLIGGTNEVGRSELFVKVKDGSTILEAGGTGSKESRHLDAVVRARGKEKRVRLKNREGVSEGFLNLGEDETQPAGQSVKYEECYPCLGDEDNGKQVQQKVLVVGTLAALVQTVQGIFGMHGCASDARQPDIMSLIKAGQLISQHVATYLVDVACMIPWHQYTSFVSSDIWRSVPYLKLSAVWRYESGGLRNNVRRVILTVCRKDDNTIPGGFQDGAEGASLLVGDESYSITQSCTLSSPGPPKRGLCRAPSSFGDDSFMQPVLDSDKHSKVLSQVALIPPEVDDLSSADGIYSAVSTLPQPCVAAIVEQTDAGAVVSEALAVVSEEEKVCQEGDIQAGGVTFICSSEVCTSGSSREPLGSQCADVPDGRATNPASQVGSMSEVRIGTVSEQPEEKEKVCQDALESVDTVVVECHQRPDLDDKWRLLRGSGENTLSTKEKRMNCSPGRLLDHLNIKVGLNGEDLDGSKDLDTQDSLSVRGLRKSALAVIESGVEFARSWKCAKRGFLQMAGEDLEGNAQGVSSNDLIGLSKRQKVHIESFSTLSLENGGKENGGKVVPHPAEHDANGDKTSRSMELRESEASLPRVNVLKLRRCPTNKGLWRVAGNSYLPDRGARPSSDSGEPLTPSSVADRKRPFGHCSEACQPESPDENGHSIAFLEGSYHDQEKAMIPGAHDLRVKDIWSNCEVSSLQEVTSNSRKRLRNGSTSSASSDDADAPFSRGEDIYQNGAPPHHGYFRESDSLCHGCIANVLVVQNDRGWREIGASVELQSGHAQGWMLIVSVHGETLFAHKAEHAVATGTTNRYTHAMMWKGGKGWSLEFEDRKQWQVFKDMHEECFRQNARASSVRHIPIPGVKHIEEFAPNSPGCHFTRPYSRYICRVEDEVEVALANSRVMYDMDSEDEQWLAQINSERASARGTRSRPLIAEGTLERLMDKLEKDAFIQQQEQSPWAATDVAAESCNGLASQEVIRVIHAYWSAKRLRKGMALVRHFQPAPWEQYQKQVDSWELELSQLQQKSPMASRQQLMLEFRKPPLFAFCLRPRGLEAARHKLLKQKSQKKQNYPATASRQWVGVGTVDGSLDSPFKRQCCTEPVNGAYAGPKRYGRPRLTEEAVTTDLADSFNVIAGDCDLLKDPVGGAELGNNTSTHMELAQRRIRKNKKVGRKARRLRLLAAAQESRRKRLLLRNMSPVKVYQQSDVAVAAAIARSTAEAARARAQALYAVADAAMHKAVAAVIAADALHTADLRQVSKEEKLANGGIPVGGPSFGSWRRAVTTAATRSLSARGSSSRPGLMSDGDDALLPVASWSQELGSGLGTRLLDKEGSLLAGGLGRTRGESMMAMLTSR